MIEEINGVQSLEKKYDYDGNSWARVLEDIKGPRWSKRWFTRLDRWFIQLCSMCHGMYFLFIPGEFQRELQRKVVKRDQLMADLRNF